MHKALALVTGLFAITMPSAQAALWVARCSTYEALGADHAAECSGELFMRSSGSGEPGELTLRTGYATRSPREELVAFTVQVHRIEMPSDATAVLTVAGVRLERTLPPANQATVAQGPAGGRCEVQGLDQPEPEFLCTVQAADPAIGNLRFAVRVDAAASLSKSGSFTRSPTQELRNARFTLAAAEQAGRLAAMPALRQAQAGAAQASTGGPLAEKSCVTETQARQAEALAATGGAAAARVAGTCWRQAAGREPDQADARWQRALDWYDKAAAQGDSRALVDKGMSLQMRAQQGRWDAASGTVKRGTDDELARAANEAGVLFRRAADVGDAEGRFRLCEHLLQGDFSACGAGTYGTRTPEQLRCQSTVKPRDVAGAVRQCQAAADQGHAGATARLAALYANGTGVPKDTARSRQLVRLAAERGDVGTLHNLARAYEAGMADSPAGPIERDVGHAIELYRRLGNERKVAELEAAQGRLGAGVDATVYGIGVGFPLPSLPQCDGVGADADARLCLDADTGALVRLLDRLGIAREDFAGNGLRLLSLKVNDRAMDTSLLFSVLGTSAPLDAAIDANRTVHYVSAGTRITASEQVLQMLTAKYGRPTRTEMADWKDLRTGALVRRTPVHHWALRGLSVDFHAQSPSAVGNLETPLGRIDVYTPLFADLLARFEAQKAVGARKGRF